MLYVACITLCAKHTQFFFHTFNLMHVLLHVFDSMYFNNMLHKIKYIKANVLYILHILLFVGVI